ncbi:uncharacterized protein C1orf105 homolog [Manis javanica]|uniref:uncharacterized protein C1orf105 homolog n=1 Tax=Manis javanica TaxID=9974 RepID=UPI003C6D7DFA
MKVKTLTEPYLCDALSFREDKIGRQSPLKGSPQASATSLVSSEKDVNLPVLFQVPDVSSKVQPRTVVIANNLKLPLENFMSHSVHYRLPILGPRMAVFHGLLTDAYKTLQETQLSSSPRKEPIRQGSEAVSCWSHHLPDSQGENHVT